MISKIKKMFALGRPCPATRDCQTMDSSKLLKVSVDTEVDLIKAFLEKKFGYPFQMRIKIEGWLGGEIKYRLVVDDYCESRPRCGFHVIYGTETTEVLDVKSSFLTAYWSNIEKMHSLEGKSLDKWDSDWLARHKETMVAKSREELFIRAELEGMV